MKEIKITPIRKEEKHNPSLVSELTSLINEVYKVAEAGMWQPNTPRLTHEETAELIAQEEICVATIDQKVCGSVRIRRIDRDTFEFGILVCRPDLRGIGIGRSLVQFAEETARQAGAKKMQLELLSPRAWKHEFKERLKEWYARIGYQVVKHGDFAIENERHAQLLTSPCDFAVYQKALL